MGYDFLLIPLKAEDQIITVRSEYGSNVIAYLHRAKQTGAELVILKIMMIENPTDRLRKLTNKKTKLISMSYIPTGGSSEPKRNWRDQRVNTVSIYWISYQILGRWQVDNSRYCIFFPQSQKISEGREVLAFYT